MSYSHVCVKEPSSLYFGEYNVLFGEHVEFSTIAAGLEEINLIVSRLNLAYARGFNEGGATVRTLLQTDVGDKCQKQR